MSSGCYGQSMAGCGGMASHCETAMEPSCGAAYNDCASGPASYGMTTEPSCGMAVAPSCGAAMYSQQGQQRMSDGQYPASPNQDDNYGNMPSAPNESGLDNSPSDRNSTNNSTSTDTPPPPADGSERSGDTGTGT